jgi:hypothetical protein
MRRISVRGHFGKSEKVSEAFLRKVITEVILDSIPHLGSSNKFFSDNHIVFRVTADIKNHLNPRSRFSLQIIIGPAVPEWTSLPLEVVLITKSHSVQ